MDHLPEALRKVWKDCCKGRVLLCTTALDSGTRSLLSGLACSPFGRVPKLNPDRTVSSEGRLVHDLRELNVTGHKHDHPPALQSRHHSVARLILWWKARHPGVDILLAKRDIADAFKWLWAHDQLAGLFGTEFPGVEFDPLCSVIAIYLCFTFGWLGGPGEYMIFGYAYKLVHAAHCPAEPAWNDDVPFDCRLLMDDGILVEPDLGRRRWVSGRTAEGAMRSVFGPDAVNEEKKRVEG